MKIPVLKKDESWSEHLKKLNEEVKELADEMEYIDKDLFEEIGYQCIIEEALDVIQVCIGIIDKAETKYHGKLKKASKEHIRKLMERGWTIKKVLQVVED